MEGKNINNFDEDKTTVITPLENKAQIPNIIKNFRSITRLFIGSLVIGIDTLSNGMNNWDSLDDKNNNSIQPSLLDTAKESETDFSPSTTDNQDEIRYALVGLLFKSQDYIESGLDTVDRVSRKISDIANPMIRPITNSWLAKPFQKRFSQLVSRGEEEVSNWIAIGKNEEIRSKKLVETAAIDQVDNVMLYLAEKPEVQEIIQGQSISLASEIVEEIRERAVSADNLIEGFIRITFRMKSRSELPDPPAEVKARAILIHQIRGKTTPNG